ICKVELEGLAMPDALSLLYKVMQTAGVTREQEREALVGLLGAVERHPLSIELVGPHLRNMGAGEIVRDFETLLDRVKRDDAGEARDRWVKGSLEFSMSGLRAGAGEAVKWLGLFTGGVFEHILLRIGQMETGVWDKARGELEATALVGVERDVM